MTFIARTIAHLHCLFDWRLSVCYGPDWMGCEKNGLVYVITYPVYLVRIDK